MISPDQKPIGSGFSPATTAAEAIRGIDLHGRVAVVTGGYSGIGLETTRALADAGATVIVPARDHARATAALSGIHRVELETLDLAEAASVTAFAERFRQSGRPLSILINSAGIMATPLHRNNVGREGQFATNHLGHFRLTLALWPSLLAAGRCIGGARVVSVSSRAHQISGIDFDDIDFERRSYDKWIAYGQSKTANALFAVALDRRGQDHGVRAFSLHPGQILTELSRHLTVAEIASFDAVDAEGRPRIDPSRGMKTAAQGAATSVWCATSPQLDGIGGVYCEDCDVALVCNEATGRSGVYPWAADDVLAERLWSVSEALTGVTLP